MQLVSFAALAAFLWVAVAAGLPQPHQEPLQQTTSNSPFELFDKDLDDYIENLLHYYHVPGFSIAVVDNGRITAKGYGNSSLSPESQPATADTLYFTASTTKAFTAAIAALLVQNNTHYPQVQLSTPLHSLIPDDFVLGRAYEYQTLHTTLEDAMSHRSGMPRHDLAYGWTNDDSTDYASIKQMVRNLRYLPLTAEPRTRWQYSNTMYGVVADVVESLTGRNVGDLLEEWVWHPLGMTKTTFDLKKARALSEADDDVNLARGYLWYNPSQDDDLTYHDLTQDCCFTPEPYMNLSTISGAGATISSVNDYALWIRTLLSVAAQDIPSETKPPGNEQAGLAQITPELFHTLVSPRSFLSPDMVPSTPLEYTHPPYYALGWVTTTIPGIATQEPVITHGGGLPGFGTDLYLLPNVNGIGKEGFGIISIGNTGEGSHIVGALVASRLILKKAWQSSNFSITFTEQELASHLERTGDLWARSSLFKPGPWTPGSQPWREPTLDQLSLNQPSLRSPAGLPASHDASCTGIYTHPAYGTFNITHAADPSTLSSAVYDSIPKTSSLRFIANPSHRTLQFVTTLKSLNTSDVGFFAADTYMLRGPFRPDADKTDSEEDNAANYDAPAGSQVRNRVVLQHLLSGLAYFEHGPEDYVERLGIELEPEMMRAARETEQLSGVPKYAAWRDSMIWFDKTR